MGGYDFLQGIRVLEVAQLGPSSLGGYLADMGAEVIKVEGLDGDPLRHTSTPAVGAADGASLLHLRWNRGKKSVGLDLKTEAGARLFRDLAEKSDVVIEGMRAGVLDRLGLGYETLRELNPRIVFCSISGLGRSGPYCRLGSHGPSFDAFGGLSSKNPYGLSPEERARTDWAPIGMHAMGLNAALGTLAAVVRAQRCGQGALIEVTGAESAAHWLPEGVDAVLNEPLLHTRPGFYNSAGRMAGWPRLNTYQTLDGFGIFFQGFFPKFWKRFCSVVERPDLAARYESGDDIALVDEQIHQELSAIFATRRRDEWMAIFLEYDVPGGPANMLRDLATDPHFLARHNIYEVEYPGIGKLRLASTPVKTPGQTFAPTLAPTQWQHSAEVLGKLLGIDGDELERLKKNRVVY
ncbi:MAG: CoA-transferase [Hydrocarboniphaga sp.]|uniref:CaiB/BaiF CoA transferase family protein n=1 Tax=Hydrocarboniphaga sp. TaxID=2033016 RepID=UPI0026212BA2|nr:CoA transferase [Hydrocarboniphaga sp.]MDB5970139.1 CoA-transferase [Hydrocarboniphaga sp.]